MKKIAYLRMNSYYSFLSGLNSPRDLVEQAVKYEIPYLALTDHNNTTGTIEFYDSCLSAGIKPVFGIEIDVDVQLSYRRSVTGSIVLYAINSVGWSSLCKLTSLSMAQNGVSLDDLSDHHQGLLCLTGGVKGSLYKFILEGQKSHGEKLLSELHSIFKDNVYVELQNHDQRDQEINLSLVRIAHKRKLPCVASHSIHYIDPKDAYKYRLVTAIHENSHINHPDLSSKIVPNANFLPPSELVYKFTNIPSAVENSFEVAVRCNGIPPLDITHFPHLDLPVGETADSILRRKSFLGIRKLYPDITPEIQYRLDHELKVIEDLGYAPIFLVMQEIIDYANTNGIPTASRGSASSSLVAHCLGITTPDPIKHNLYFERFLNPARKTPPDIDTDICSRRRDELLNFVTTHFGSDNVAMVSTISRFRSRSAIRESAKAHGFNQEEINKLTKDIPGYWYSRRTGEDSPFASIRKKQLDPAIIQVIDDAEELIGLPDHLSVHPGGIVISPVPIKDLVPTQQSTKGISITQFDLESIERLGLVKIDLLGIRGLTVLGDVANALTKKTPSSRNPLQILEDIPLEDSDTQTTIQKAQTIGCFQIESPGMRATLKEIRASSVDDILVALALYRPGPLTGGLKDSFVRRHLGLEEPKQLHPSLTPLLKDTYGVILYQEQVLRIAHELAGFSLADADLLRRAMSHFDPGKEMQTLKQKFISGALNRHGIPESTADQIWELMAAFAGYGFPKAHAASYAVVAWRAAWCKTHHPDLFMASVLAGGGGYYSQRVYINEARRLGISMSPPRVNEAKKNFSLTYLAGKPVIYIGLNYVKELTKKTQNRILTLRPFTSFSDFLARVDPSKVEAENLVRCGALSNYGSIPYLLAELKKGWLSNQYGLWETTPDMSNDWTIQEKVLEQEKILGVGIDAHPLEMVAIPATVSNTIDAINSLGQKVRIAGMKQSWRRTSDKTGKFTYILTLEDLEGTIQVRIPASVYQRNRMNLDGYGPFLIEGTVDLYRVDREPVLTASSVEKLS